MTDFEQLLARTAPWKLNRVLPAYYYAGELPWSEDHYSREASEGVYSVWLEGGRWVLSFQPSSGNPARKYLGRFDTVEAAMETVTW